MSLGVKLDHVRGPGPPGERLARVTFRGVSRVSRMFLHSGDTSFINQLLEWPIARGINGDEKLEIQILAHNKFLSNRVICHVSFSLHRLLEESCIQLAASLLDNTDKPTKAILHVVVWYSGPGQYNNHSNGLESDMEEDNQALVNLERNIANLERSLSASQLGKGDLTSILNRQHGSNQSLDTAGNNRGSGHQRSKYHTTSETQADRRKRRRSASASEEQNLLGSSQEHDRDTGDEAAPGVGDSCDEADTARSRRESGASCASDNRSVLSVNDEKRRSKKSKK